MIKHRGFHLTLDVVAAIDDQDAILRLRAALKGLWRSYRLRCVSITAEPRPDDRERAEPNLSH